MSTPPASGDAIIIPCSSGGARMPPESYPSDSPIKYIHACQHCGRAERDGETMKKCGACKAERYCDNKCQKAAWSTHKAICKKRREVLAVVGRRPESLELYNAMRDFLRKHRVALMILGPCSVLHFYAPPYTSDPATAVQTREDVLYIYLRQRPNAESARPETLFIVTDVQLETMDSIPADQREELRIGMDNCKEGAMRQEGPCGAMLVVMYYPDVAGPITCDSSRGFMVVFPIVFPSDQTCHTVTQWKRYLLHLLNGGVLL